MTAHTVYPSLRDKRVVVTGGGSSIGAAIVERFAQQGARVAFLDIAEAESRELERRLADNPTPPRYYRCDLTDIAAVQELFPGLQGRAADLPGSRRSARYVPAGQRRPLAEGGAGIPRHDQRPPR